MNQPLTPEAAPKKGMSTFVKVLLGCGVLLLLGIGSCVVVSGYFLKKGVGKLSDFAKEMESNPDAAVVRAAELALRLNPEVDVVSSDPAAGTITVREKKTGKEVTFNLEDIKAGKFSIEADGEKANIDIDATEENGGQMKVVTDQGTAVFGAGGQKAPDWIPSYPGGRHRRPGEHRGQRREDRHVHRAHGRLAGHRAGFLRDQAQGGRFRGAEGELELQRRAERDPQRHRRLARSGSSRSPPRPRTAKPRLS